MDTELKAALRNRLAVILGRNSGDLAAAIRFLDENRSRVPGSLSHYLAKRSYQKAWDWLEGDNPEAGSCGPGH